MAWLWIGATVGDWTLDHNGRWSYDENAPSPGKDPALTQIVNLPTPMPPPGRVEYSGVTDHRPTPADEPSGDIGDHIDPITPDPTGDEITDPNHPDYVTPYPDATPVD